MTVEQLLKDRYKVVSPYPGAILELNSIFDCPENMKVHMTEYVKDYPKDYPHLFKPLHWSEEREEKDMPGYVKPVKADQYIFKVASLNSGLVTYWDLNRDIKTENAKAFLPATIEEYNEYIKGK